MGQLARATGQIAGAAGQPAQGRATTGSQVHCSGPSCVIFAGLWTDLMSQTHIVILRLELVGLRKLDDVTCNR